MKFAPATCRSHAVTGSAVCHRIFARLDALNGVWGDEYLYAMLGSEWSVAR